MSSIHGPFDLRHLTSVQKYFPEPKHTDEEIDAKTLELSRDSEDLQQLLDRFFNREIDADQLATELGFLRDKLGDRAEDILNEPREDQCEESA